MPNWPRVDRYRHPDYPHCLPRPFTNTATRFRPWIAARAPQTSLGATHPGMAAAMVAQIGQEAALGIQLRSGAELHHQSVGRDSVDQHPLHACTLLEPATLDHVVAEVDHPHLPHRGGIEADLVDPVQDIACRAGQLWPLDRTDVNDRDIAGVAAIDQREDGRIGRVAAVPVMLAIDLNRLEQEREAGGSQHRLGADLRPLEYLDLPVRTLVAARNTRTGAVGFCSSSKSTLAASALRSGFRLSGFNSYGLSSQPTMSKPRKGGDHSRPQLRMRRSYQFGCGGLQHAASATHSQKPAGVHLAACRPPTAMP